MSRKNAREVLFRLVFEYLFTKELNDNTEAMMLSDATLAADDKKYISSCYRGIAEHYDELTTLILKHTTSYSSIDRLVKADLVGMLVSTYEMKYLQDIPVGVSINEAVDLVKQYSTSKSSGFVNGVLASIYKEIKGENG